MTVDPAPRRTPFRAALPALLRTLLAASLLATAGCDETPAPTPADAGGECSLTSVRFDVRNPDRGYSAPPTDAELVLGFQGFRFIYIRIGTEGLPVPPFGSVNGKVQGGGPISQSFRLDLAEDGPGRWVTRPIMVLFDDAPLSELVDHRADLTVTVGDGTCVADEGGIVTLRFDGSCYEGPTGERICADGGLPAPDDAGFLPLPDAGPGRAADTGP